MSGGAARVWTIAMVLARKLLWVQELPTNLPQVRPLCHAASVC
jgi:hypothetical protein